MDLSCMDPQDTSLSVCCLVLPQPPVVPWLFFFLSLIFIYLFMAVLDLRLCARAFSSCGKWGPLFIAVRGPPTIAAPPVAEHRLQTRRLSNCGSRAQSLRGTGIFPDQGSNPCPLRWQADSQPLRHQGSPVPWLLKSGEIPDALAVPWLF